jgi:hypothetical protein
MSTPLKGVAWTLGFTLYTNAGAIIGNPGTYTKKVKIDGGNVADIAASVTEEDTTYGALSLVLSTSEMNGDRIWVSIKDDTAGCVPFTATIYPAAYNPGAEAALVHAHAATIEADTNEIQAELADGGRTDLILDGIATDTDTIIAALPTTNYRFLIKT